MLLLLSCQQSHETSGKPIASTCEGRRCSGDASCSACKNCSGCKHCAKEGGTCGVCSGGVTLKQSYYSKPSASKKRSKDKKTLSTGTTVSNYYSGQILLPTIESINLRNGPGTDYEILETFGENQTVIFISKIGDWLKVQVEDTGTVGYVNIKYLN